VVFVDAGALIARYNDTDDFHQAASRGWDRLERAAGGIVTTDLCVAEAVTVLARQIGDYEWAAQVADEIRSYDMEMIAPSRDDLTWAARKMRVHAKKRLGFVDAISFAIMDRRRFHVAFTFDERFKKIGRFGLWEPIPPAPRSS
jgi:predicted nucleic acid-binding protein